MGKKTDFYFCLCKRDSGDIRSMFYQVCLLPEDLLLLYCLQCDGERELSPDVCEWHVLPFGTTCSPCFATYTLQLSANNTDSQESTLGLQPCSPDTLEYIHQSIPPTEPILRYVCRMMASQYDPLGNIIPCTTQA